MKKLHFIIAIMFVGSSLFGQTATTLFDSLSRQMSTAVKPAEYALLAARFNALSTMEASPWG